MNTASKYIVFNSLFRLRVRPSRWLKSETVFKVCLISWHVGDSAFVLISGLKGGLIWSCMAAMWLGITFLVGREFGLWRVEKALFDPVPGATDQ